MSKSETYLKLKNENEHASGHENSLYFLREEGIGSCSVTEVLFHLQTKALRIFR